MMKYGDFGQKVPPVTYAVGTIIDKLCHVAAACAREWRVNRTPTRKLRALMRHAAHVRRWTRYWKKRHNCYWYVQIRVESKIVRVSRYGAYCETCRAHLLRT